MLLSEFSLHQSAIEASWLLGEKGIKKGPILNILKPVHSGQTMKKQEFHPSEFQPGNEKIHTILGDPVKA